MTLVTLEQFTAGYLVELLDEGAVSSVSFG
jgi:hypothetical protein